MLETIAPSIVQSFEGFQNWHSLPNLEFSATSLAIAIMSWISLCVRSFPCKNTICLQCRVILTCSTNYIQWILSIHNGRNGCKPCLHYYCFKKQQQTNNYNGEMLKNDHQSGQLVVSHTATGQSLTPMHSLTSVSALSLSALPKMSAYHWMFCMLMSDNLPSPFCSARNRDVLPPDCMAAFTVSTAPLTAHDK